MISESSQEAKHVLELLFFLLLFLMLYSYAFFPPLLWALKCFKRRAWRRSPQTIPVSIIISVYNEEKVIKDKIENALALNYAPEKLEIIVSSDGSTDGTHGIVEGFDDPRIVLKRFERIGKTACLNRVLPEAKGDIVLFTDANAMFPSDLLSNLVANFADQDVGLVTGWDPIRDARRWQGSDRRLR